MVLLGNADGATRARVMRRLQRDHGNTYVQRLLAAPRKPKDFVDFYGVRWSRELPHLRGELTALIRRAGFRRAFEIVGYFRDEAAVQMRIADHKGGTTVWAEILPVTETAFTALTHERDALLHGFEQSGIDVLLGILDQSEQLLIQEQKRYGLRGEQNERSTVQDNEHTAGLVEAVRELIEKRELADAAAEEATVSSEGFGVDPVDTMFPPPDEAGAEAAQSTAGPGAAGPGVAAAAAELSAERTLEYQHLQTEATARYPILAAFAGPESTGHLAELASGQKEPLTQVLGGETDSRLLDIRKLRAAARDRQVTVWELPDLVRKTKRSLALTDDGYDATLVDERLAEYQASKSARTLWLSVFALAAGLVAAIPSGGTSLGATAAVVGAQAAGAGAGIYLTYSAVSDHRLQSLASRAGLAERPSALQLGLDLLLTAFDLQGLIKASAALRPLLAGAARRQAVTNGLQTLGPDNPASAKIVQESLQEFGVHGTSARAGRTLKELCDIVGEGSEAGLMIRRAHALDIAARLSDENGLRLVDELPARSNAPEADLAELAERHGVAGQLGGALSADALGAHRAAAIAAREASEQQARILALTPESSRQAIADAMLRNEGIDPVLEIARGLSARTTANVLDEIPIHGRSAASVAAEQVAWAERRGYTDKLVAAIKATADATDHSAAAALAAADQQARILALTPRSSHQAIADAMLRNEGIDPVLEIARKLRASTGYDFLPHMTPGAPVGVAADLTTWAARRGLTGDLVAAVKALNP